jgi:hypothetical protein
VPVFDWIVPVFDWKVPVFDWKVPVFDRDPRAELKRRRRRLDSGRGAHQISRPNATRAVYQM